MNKLKVAAIILLVFAAGALAGSLGNKLYFKHKFEHFARGGHPPLMHILMGKMAYNLNLTETQKTDIKKILRQSDEKILNFREKYHPEFEKIIDDTMTQIKEKLNDEQKKKLDQIHEKLKARGRMGHRGMHHRAMMGGDPDQLFATMKERLNLTKEQEEKIRPIIDASAEKKRAALKKHREEIREDMQAVDKDTEKQLGSVLTEEQLKGYQKLQEEHCEGMHHHMPPEGKADHPSMP